MIHRKPVGDLFDKCRRFLNRMEADQKAFLDGGEEVFFGESPVGNAGPVVAGGNGEILQFGSNDYLGLSRHPEVRRAAEECVREYGVAMPVGSRALTGTTRLHLDLERDVAAFKGTGDAVTFSTGAGAMMGALGCLAEPGDTLILDHQVHASLCCGAEISGAKITWFHHNDTAHLAKVLAAVEPDSCRMVVVDGVYSMTGDIAPLVEISRLCRSHSARLLVDDAHGNGVFGKGGRGVAAHLGLPQDAVDLHAGTFSKAFGTAGGFVAGDKDIIRYIRCTAPTMLFTKAAPACVVAATRAAFRLLPEAEGLRGKLWENTGCLQSSLKAAGFSIGSTQSPITPVEFAGFDAVRIAHALRQRHGIWVPATVFPAIRRGVSMLRITPCAGHSTGDIRRLVEALAATTRGLRASPMAGGS